MQIRAAIWLAVSSKAQAKADKVSIDVQTERAREVIASRGWVESAGPYIAIESRTRWVNLKDAAVAIPSLALLMTEAQAHLFDVLIIFDYTRLRSLLTPLSKTLSAYAIQIYSLSQPTEVIDPAKYDPTNADTASIMEFAAGFTSEAEIASLKRRYRIGMPKRITEKGLPKGTVPYGYRKPIGHETDRFIVPEQNPIQAPVLITMKDLFLKGQSSWQIANHLIQQGIPTPRNNTNWTDVKVRGLLLNKFYSGEVSFGRTRIVTDPLTGKRRVIDNPPAAIKTGVGKHIPLWDKPTAKLIEDEFKRRSKSYSGITTARLSNLLYCGTCGARLWVEYPGGYADQATRQYSCSATRSHITIREKAILPRFISELTNSLKNTNEILNHPQQQTAPETATLTELTTRKSRILDLYEAGALTIAEYTARTQFLTTQIDRIQEEQHNQTRTAARIKQKSEALNSFASILAGAPNFLAEAPAQQVNTHLRRIISKIILTYTTTTIEFVT